MSGSLFTPRLEFLRNCWDLKGKPKGSSLHGWWTKPIFPSDLTSSGRASVRVVHTFEVAMVDSQTRNMSQSWTQGFLHSFVPGPTLIIAMFSSLNFLHIDNGLILMDQTLRPEKTNIHMLLILSIKHPILGASTVSRVPIPICCWSLTILWMFRSN